MVDKKLNQTFGKAQEAEKIQEQEKPISLYEKVSWSQETNGVLIITLKALRQISKKRWAE